MSGPNHPDLEAAKTHDGGVVPEQPSITTTTTTTKNNGDGGVIGSCRSSVDGRLAPLSERILTIMIAINVGVALGFTLLAMAFRWSLWIAFISQLLTVFMCWIPFCRKRQSNSDPNGGDGSYYKSNGLLHDPAYRKWFLASVVSNTLGLVFVVTSIFVIPVYWIWLVFVFISLALSSFLIMKINKARGLA